MVEGTPETTALSIYADGLAGLTDSETSRLRFGNATFYFTCRIIRICMKLNIPVVLENPSSSLMWHANALALLTRASSAHVCDLDQCQFGTPWQKRTRFATWGVGPLDRIALRCDGRGGICSRTRQRHVILSGQSPFGCKYTALAAAYPSQLCDSLAKLIRNAMLGKTQQAMAALISR